ncbi:MAG: Transaldolase, partial [uncultured Thermomicrobiales bacterium]
RPGAGGAEGQGGGRQRQARLRTVRGDLPLRAVRPARRRRRQRPAPALGQHLGQEPGLPRRALRRGADRPRHRQHDAAADDRGVPRPRRRRPHGRHRPGRRAADLGRAGRGGDRPRGRDGPARRRRHRHLRQELRRPDRRRRGQAGPDGGGDRRGL